MHYKTIVQFESHKNMTLYLLVDMDILLKYEDVLDELEYYFEKLDEPINVNEITVQDITEFDNKITTEDLKNQDLFDYPDIIDFNEDPAPKYELDAMRM